MGRFSKLELNRSDKPLRPGATAKDFGVPDEDPTLKFRTAEGEEVHSSDPMAEGDEAFFIGEEKMALRWYSRAIQNDNTNIKAWIAYVRTLILMRNLEEANVWLTRAFSAFPNAPQLISLRAVIHAKSGMVRQAIGASDMVLSQKGASADLWMARGFVLLTAEAKNTSFCFNECMNMTGESDWQTPMLIGMIYHDSRLWVKSIEYFHKALERRSELPLAWYRIGLASAELGRKEAAQKAYLSARMMCEDNPKLLGKIEVASTGSFAKRIKSLFKRK